MNFPSFPFILDSCTFHPDRASAASHWGEYRSFCEHFVDAPQPPDGLVCRTTHWPSVCLCQQKSDQSSPSQAGWDAHTPCPSSAVLWSASAKARIKEQRVLDTLKDEYIWKKDLFFVLNQRKCPNSGWQLFSLILFEILENQMANEIFE